MLISCLPGHLFQRDSLCCMLPYPIIEHLTLSYFSRVKAVVLSRLLVVVKRDTILKWIISVGKPVLYDLVNFLDTFT